MNIIIQIEDRREKPVISREILDDLPSWFGIKKSKEEYIENSKDQVFFSFYDEVLKKHLGFLTIKKHFLKSAEIAVMGVLAEHHRQGVGKKLIFAAEDWCKKEGISFLQVKTLSEDNKDEYYKKTRLFYLSMGFSELEVFKTLWDKNNPCLILIKKI